MLGNYTVYKHTNKANGKVYIGITRQTVERRWQNGHGYAGTYFGNAIEKYGWDGFDHEVWFTGLTKEMACSMEQAMILAHKSNQREHGYNVSAGGEMCDCVTVRSGADNPRATAVIRIDPATGERVRFITMDSAAHATGVQRKGIGKACKGILNTYKGFIWEYDDPGYVKPKKYGIGKYPHTKRMKRVKLTEPDGKVSLFASLKEACEITGCPSTSLYRYLHNIALDRSGRMWEYDN